MFNHAIQLAMQLCSHVYIYIMDYKLRMYLKFNNLYRQKVSYLYLYSYSYLYFSIPVNQPVESIDTETSEAEGKDTNKLEGRMRMRTLRLWLGLWGFGV